MIFANAYSCSIVSVISSIALLLNLGENSYRYMQRDLHIIDINRQVAETALNWKKQRDKDREREREIYMYVICMDRQPKNE